MTMRALPILMKTAQIRVGPAASGCSPAGSDRAGLYLPPDQLQVDHGPMAGPTRNRPGHDLTRIQDASESIAIGLTRISVEAAGRALAVLAASGR